MLRRSLPSIPRAAATALVAAATALVAAALCACGQHRQRDTVPASTSPTSTLASATAPALASDPVEIVCVPQRPLGRRTMVFHPSRAIVGEITGARCDLWDLDEARYRGAVDATECAHWPPSAPWIGDGGDPIGQGRLHVDSTFADPGGRYVGYVGTISAKVDFNAAGVVRLADAKELIGHAEMPDYAERSVLWADEAPVALAVDTCVIPVEACEDQSIAVARYGIAEGSVDMMHVERGMLGFAAQSPDGAVALIAVTEIDERCTEENLGSRVKRPVTHLLRRGSQSEIAGLATAAAFAPGGVVAMILGGSVVVFDGARRIAAWKGEAPLSFAPDGRRLASIERGALTVRAVRSLSAPRPISEGARVVAWGAHMLAVASARELALFDGSTLAPGSKLALEGITALAWNRAGTRLAARIHESVIVIDEVGHAALPIPTAVSARVTWAAGGELVIHEPRRFQRLTEASGAWTMSSEAPIASPHAASAGGEFELDGEIIRRLADSEAIHFGDPGPFTDSGAFEKTPPSDWIFREGDALSGRLFPATGTAFLRPTPDLVKRFVTGAPIPHPRAEKN